MRRKYSIIGLGKLGASMAAAIASRGHFVIGVDVNPAAVRDINEGRPPVMETGLADLIKANAERLSATTDASKAIRGSDVTFVVVPTPSEPDGHFSLKYVVGAAGELARALAEKDDYHLVVVTSTVLPGSMRYAVLPLLERISGKRCGEDFGLCYSPEFIALGSVVRDFLNPDFLLIGQSDSRAGTTLADSYKEIVLNDAPVRIMSFENAELAKIALNSYVTMKITFANMLAQICERLPAGSVDAVTGAIGLDRRIGSAFLRGGLGYGGPCFPRDNRALTAVARDLSVAAPLPSSTDDANNTVIPRIVERLLAKCARGDAIAVLGLSYKPLSNVTEESQGLKIAIALDSLGYKVRGFDPLVGDLPFSAPSADSALDGAAALVVAAPDRSFAACDLSRMRPGAFVLDCWRILDAAAISELGYKYEAVGLSLRDDAPELARVWRTYVDVASTVAE